MQYDWVVMSEMSLQHVYKREKGGKKKKTEKILDRQNQGYDDAGKIIA
jgi:hypothetical protein